MTPRILAAGISYAAVSTMLPVPAFAGDCVDADIGTGSAACSPRKQARVPTPSLQAATRLPATLPDDEIPPSLLGPLLDFGLDGIELFKRLDAPGTRLGQQPTWLMPSRPTPAMHSAATGVGMWSKLEKNQSSDNARTRSGVGVDYRANRSATIGMAVENEENVADTSSTEQSKLAATFGLKTSPLMNLEAKAAWARHNTADLVSRGTQGAQSELSARFNGDWRLGAFKLTPSATVAHTSEAGMPEAAKAPKGTIIVAPSISRPVALEGAQILEPFLTFKQEIDISAPALQVGTGGKPETVRSAGGGFKLERKDNYSLSVTTDVENLDAERHSVKSQLRLNLPLK